MLTALAASDHLAYNALCFVSIFSLLVGPPLLGAPKFFFSPGPEPALGGPGSERPAWVKFVSHSGSKRDGNVMSVTVIYELLVVTTSIH